MVWDKIEPDRLYTYLIVGLSLTVPGAGYLFYFSQPLFETLGTANLLLSSLFISAPMFLFGIFIVAASQDEDLDKDDKKFLFKVSLRGAFTSIVIFFLTTGYWIVRNPTGESRPFMFLLYQVFGGLLIVNAVKGIWRTRKATSKSKNQDVKNMHKYTNKEFSIIERKLKHNYESVRDFAFTITAIIFALAIGYYQVTDPAFKGTIGFSLILLGITSIGLIIVAAILYRKLDRLYNSQLSKHQWEKLLK